MIIRIEEKQVPFGIPMLNGESIAVIIEKVTTVNNKIVIKTEMERFEGGSYKGYIIGESNEFILDSENMHNMVVAAKVLKEYLQEKYSMTDEGISILAEKEWRHPDRPIRLTIPIDRVVENENYTALISSLIASGLLYYKVNDIYIVYLAQIYPEHRALLDIDENVFIEE